MVDKILAVTSDQSSPHPGNPVEKVGGGYDGTVKLPFHVAPLHTEKASKAAQLPFCLLNDRNSIVSTISQRWNDTVREVD